MTNLHFYFCIVSKLNRRHEHLFRLSFRCPHFRFAKDLLLGCFVTLLFFVIGNSPESIQIYFYYEENFIVCVSPGSAGADCV